MDHINSKQLLMTLEELDFDIFSSFLPHFPSKSLFKSYLNTIICGNQRSPLSSETLEKLNQLSFNHISKTIN